MNKFEQKEMRKKRSVTNTRYNWLINYVSNPSCRWLGKLVKVKVKSLFKTNALKEYGKKNFA